MPQVDSKCTCETPRQYRIPENADTIGENSPQHNERNPELNSRITSYIRNGMEPVRLSNKVFRNPHTRHTCKSSSPKSKLTYQKGYTKEGETIKNPQEIYGSPKDSNLNSGTSLRLSQNPVRYNHRQPSNLAGTNEYEGRQNHIPKFRNIHKYSPNRYEIKYNQGTEGLETITTSYNFPNNKEFGYVSPKGYIQREGTTYGSPKYTTLKTVASPMSSQNHLRYHPQGNLNLARAHEHELENQGRKNNQMKSNEKDENAQNKYEEMKELGMLTPLGRTEYSMNNNEAPAKFNAVDTISPVENELEKYSNLRYVPKESNNNNNFKDLQRKLYEPVNRNLDEYNVSEDVPEYFKDNEETPYQNNVMGNENILKRNKYNDSGDYTKDLERNYASGYQNELTESSKKNRTSNEEHNENVDEQHKFSKVETTNEPNYEVDSKVPGYQGGVQINRRFQTVNESSKHQSNQSKSSSSEQQENYVSKKITSPAFLHYQGSNFDQNFGTNGVSQYDVSNYKDKNNNYLYSPYNNEWQNQYDYTRAQKPNYRLKRLIRSPEKRSPTIAYEENDSNQELCPNSVYINGVSQYESYPSLEYVNAEYGSNDVPASYMVKGQKFFKPTKEITYFTSGPRTSYDNPYLRNAREATTFTMTGGKLKSEDTTSAVFNEHGNVDGKGNLKKYDGELTFTKENKFDYKP